MDEDQPRGRDVATLKSERKWLSPWVWGRTEKENMVAGPENWLWESHGGKEKTLVLFHSVLLLLGISPKKIKQRKSCLTP